MLHKVDVVDMEAEHLRNPREVLHLDFARSLLVDDHAELNGLLDLLPILVVCRGHSSRGPMPR